MRLSRQLAGEVLGLYAISRLVGLVFLLIVEQQLRGKRFPGGLAFRLWESVFNRWDAGFYRMVAAGGYPAVLPTNEQGELLANTWAFFPAFPLTAESINRVTGLGFFGAAILLNLVAGAVAALCLAAIVRRIGDDRTARRAVALWTFFPTAFVLQVPYAEAVYMALGTGFLLALVERRHILAAGLLIATSLSRGYAIPLSAAALCRVWLEVRGRQLNGREGGRWGQTPNSRGLTPSSPSTPSGLILLTIAALAAPFVWIGIAAFVTGRPDAYTATQQVWGFSFDPMVAFERWRGSLWLLGRDVYFTVVVSTLALAVVVAIASFRVPLEPELKTYTLFAVAFLLAISQPEAIAFSSIPRFVFGILTMPIVVALLVRSTYVSVGLVLCYATLQYLWVLYVWTGRLGVAP